MSYPIQELILQNIHTTLAGIQTANSYNWDLIVERARAKGNRSRDLLCLPYLEDVQVLDSNPNEKTDKTMYVRVEVMKEVSTDLSLAVDQVQTMLEADIIKAMMVDRSRGGYAHDTYPPKSPEYLEDEGYVGVRLVFEVQFRHMRNDPYTA